MPRPVIGITVDTHIESGRLQCAPAYAQAVTRAGGLPLLLTQEVALIGEYLRVCDGVLLTGGDDPAMEAFGQTTHPAATVISPLRQAFELALIKGIDDCPEKPVLGICMGMQLMALVHGGNLNQHLPDTLGTAAEIHAGNNRHGVRWEPVLRQSTMERQSPVLRNLASIAGNEDETLVTSSHHQAVSDAGPLTVLATAPDGVIEAIGDLSRAFYVGVQWHPERSASRADDRLFRSLVSATVSAAAGARR